ncbi:YfaZ family outer membrane protein [Bacterioplanoides sp.]|uniref:YfaZ family outer membrane protein n=1 Tax=Bacterioplanoides sp. TaxID=2066072 RepID=UPI003B00E00B
MSQLKKLALASLVATSAAAHAGGSLDLSIANEMARVGYDATKVGSGMHVSADFLHHTDDGNIGSVGLHVVDVRNEDPDLYIGVGGKLYGFSADEADEDGDDASGAAIGLGGFFRYRLPGVPEVSVAGYAYYAPSVISFADADNLFDSDVRIQYSLIPTARVYAGYRYTGIKIEDVSDRVELGDGLHVGLKLDF